MKKISFIFMFVLVFLLTACGDVTAKNLTPQQPTTTTVDSKLQIERPSRDRLIQIKNPSAVDGDTVKGIIEGKQETVRILLVDTPETKHPTKPVEPFGPEASAFTKKFVQDNKDFLYLEPDVEERDKYGRILGYVWGKTDMLNALLVQNGLARVGYVYQSVHHLDALRKIQSEAQQKALGIWSIENYATDKGFNDNLDSKSSAKESSTPKQTTSTSSIPDANGDGKCNDIKGNVGSNGNIYHVPGGAYYEKTKAEQYFCTPKEAEDAGFRASGK